MGSVIKHTIEPMMGIGIFTTTQACLMMTLTSFLTIFVAITFQRGTPVVGSGWFPRAGSSRNPRNSLTNTPISLKTSPISTIHEDGSRSSAASIETSPGVPVDSRSLVRMSGMIYCSRDALNSGLRTCLFSLVVSAVLEDNCSTPRSMVASAVRSRAIPSI